MERWSWIAARAAEVVEEYERRAARAVYGSGKGMTAAVLEEVADVCCGLEVIDYASLPDGVLGELDPDEGSICVRSSMDPLRRAFVVAHEIGHSALGHPGRILDEEEHFDERAGPDELEAQEGVHRAYNSRALIEVEANLFAAELLVPTRVLLATITEDRQWTVEELARRFRVTRTAMLARLSNALLLKGNAGLREGGSDEDQAAKATPDLDRDQAEAVAVEAPALVVAGPGAGKTRVLAERYVDVVRSGVAEDSVLALTFSNKAAEEMRSRVSRMLGGGYRGLQTYTFHGFCMELLKGYHHLVGLPEDFTLLTETDALLLVRGRLSELDLSHLEQLSDPGLFVPGILTSISRAKDELKDPAEFEALAIRWQETAEGGDQAKAAQALEAALVYAAYERWLEEGGYVDYGDLVWKGLKVLEHPQAAEEVRARYEQILVDEFQDINFASGRFLRALDGGRGVVWAVADPDQSIYGFRGASAANLERFEDDYPGHRPVYLTKNYRSGPDIVGACHGLRGGVRSGYGGTGTPPPLEATRSSPQRPAVSLVEAPDEETELRYIVEEVRRRNEAGVHLREQAVLCATNGQAKKVTARLSAAGIAAQGPTTLLGSEEIKKTLSAVSLLRGSNGAGLLGIAADEGNPLTEQDVTKVLAWANQQNLSAREAISRSAEIGDLADEAAGFLAEMDGLLDELPAWGDAWHAVLAYAFHPRSRVRQLIYAGTDEALGRLSQLGQLAVLARSFAERGGLVEREGIPGFVDYVGELAASKRGEGALYSPPASDAVQVMTVHKSKGLEFPVVYIPNLVTRRFPGTNAGEGDVTLPPGLSRDENLSDPEEDVRCLLYVALTRAEDELVLTRSETYGNRAKPLPLMDRLVRTEGERAMVAERRLEPYPSNGHAHTSGSIAGAGAGGGRKKAAYSFRELRSYDRCSLQYKFAEILGLPEKDSAYRAFHNSVYRVLGDMEVEAERHGRNPSLAWAKERLDRIWTEEGPADHFYEAVYRRRAETVIQNWQASQGALRWRIRQKLALPGPDATEIEVTVDAIRHDEEGGIVLARHMFGRPRKGHTEKDHLDLYALYLAAARATWPGREARVVLRYLTQDESVEVPVTERVMTNRVGKMGRHVQGVLDGRFPPKPGRACKNCPWALFCRASA